MTFREYIKSLNGLFCTLFIREMSAAMREDGGRWACTGYIEVEEDFVKISVSCDFELGSVVRIEDILTIDVHGAVDPDEEDEEEEEEIREDKFDVFERMYQEYKRKRG